MLQENLSSDGDMFATAVKHAIKQFTTANNMPLNMPLNNSPLLITCR